jgi:TRAP transporter TAXI family solute receptor
MKRRSTKKGFSFLLGFLFVICTALPMALPREATAAPEKVRLSFGASSTGTWIYMFSATVADLWKRNIPGLDITVLATAGSTANYIPLDKGEIDIASAATSGDYYAMNGLYFTKTKLSNFCSFLPATKNFCHLFTYAESPIKAWKDLEGKKVHIGARASGTSISSEEICKALGIKATFVYSTPADAVDMVKDNRVDAMSYAVGAPWSSIMDIATNRKLKFISMTPQEQKLVNAATPYQNPDTIPAKTYAFQTADNQTVSGLQSLNVRPGLSDDLVYLLTKTAWQHWDEIVKSMAAAKWVKAQDMANMIVPIHPGAARYYKEIGVQIPDRLVWKKR